MQLKSSCLQEICHKWSTKEAELIIRLEQMTLNKSKFSGDLNLNSENLQHHFIQINRLKIHISVSKIKLIYNRLRILIRKVLETRHLVQSLVHLLVMLVGLWLLIDHRSLISSNAWRWLAVVQIILGQDKSLVSLN